MSKKYLTPDGLKDENGQYIKALPPPRKEAEAPSGNTIDDLLLKGLHATDLLMKSIVSDISTHAYTRDTVMNLKDVMNILSDLKKKERELLDSMGEIELQDIANQNDPV